VGQGDGGEAPVRGFAAEASDTLLRAGYLMTALVATHDTGLVGLADEVLNLEDGTVGA
jgi:hypothetical protein